ncbi:3-isopropylmalate dehydratase, small subunit [Paenibacillus curdlanolyticus YK9]|uniref:3-isopropylmalate dehydratase small subunit n=1 Tax=Paenibacillus curdlanolyticus YK9 TaxID=717606 RepID=E0I8L7_9BACL|nr:3-isopropylmalate dehydratase small subunit [Paenibacillus curdlanolyticus]EFM11522.1 3-isopropylmalate dehydratase, small subunit [Paenibacillus curdlanolyticus YK9]
MEPFQTHTGIVGPVDRSNIDTDAIIPKNFLKRIERTGFGPYLFYEWRFKEDGSRNELFEMNKPRYEGASVLLARANFGCGSSREHAPWTITDFGFRVVIASSFADIFYNNCFKNGLLPVKLDDAAIELLFKETERHEGYTLTVDLENCEIRDAYGLIIPFTLDEFRRQTLLQGLDDIALTLRHIDKIDAFEQRDAIIAG